jgi:hypothetical protein
MIRYVCDFCNDRVDDKNRRAFKVRPFAVKAHGGVIDMSTPWLVCSTCEQLVNADDYAELVARGVEGVRRRQGRATNADRDYIEFLYGSFRKFRDGACTPHPDDDLAWLAVKEVTPKDALRADATLRRN